MQNFVSVQKSDHSRPMATKMATQFRVSYMHFYLITKPLYQISAWQLTKITHNKHVMQSVVSKLNRYYNMLHVRTGKYTPHKNNSKLSLMFFLLPKLYVHVHRNKYTAETPYCFLTARLWTSSVCCLMWEKVLVWARTMWRRTETSVIYLPGMSHRN